MENASLDMRMDLSQSISAAKIINEYSYADLKEIFLLNGERNASRVAENIIKYREKSPIKTTEQLVKIADISIPRNSRSGHRAKKIFQALRIVVNNELDNLKTALIQASELLNPGGVLAVIDYHSLEARIVKQFFRKLSSPAILLNLPKLPAGAQPEFELLPTVSPTEKEILANPRSASAHLRCIRKIKNAKNLVSKNGLISQKKAAGL